MWVNVVQLLTMIAKPFIEPARWAGVRLLAMDVDGVLTDGTVQVGSDGSEAKTFSIIDGLGMKRVLAKGIPVAWISGRASKATTVRAGELGISHVIQGRTDKIDALRELARSLKVEQAQCIYIGDDDIDAPAIKWAGIGIAVPDAAPEAVDAAAYITRRAAGHGAVREVCDHILAAAGSARKP